MNTFDRAIKYLLERKFHYIAGIAALLIVDISQLYIPKIVQHIIDSIVSGNDRGHIEKYIIAIVTISVVVFFMRYTWRYLIIGTSLKIEEKLRNELFSHLLKLDRSFYNENKTGDILSLATNDLNAVRMVFGIGAVSFFDGLVMSIVSLIFMFGINPLITIYVLIPLPFITIIVLITGKYIHRKFSEVQESISKLSGYAQESFSGIRVIKGYCRETYSLEKFKSFSGVIVRKNIELTRVWGLFFPLMAAIVGISSSIVIYSGGTSSVMNKFSTGEFVAFNSYIGILSWPMMAIGWVMNLYERGKASMIRINSIMDKSPLIFDSLDSVELKEIFPEIEFKNVSFKYPGKNDYAVKDISLKIKPGEKIALVGKTGSGKTTIVSLIGRLYDVTEGDIYISGYSIKSIKLDALRGILSFVQQETYLFSESIGGNIAFSGKNPIDEFVFDSSKTADVYDSVMTFPKKFNTKLGEKGINLSGGQKQRISIARAVQKNSPVFIFDDCLSAVDTRTEKNILRSLIEGYSDRTIITITHRVASIMNSDRIYVLDQGIIKESGTHSELISMDGIYADMYARQKLEEAVS